MPKLKKICNYAKWQTSGILGVAVVSGILFLGVAYGPTSQIATDSNNIFNPNESHLEFAQDPIVEFYDDGEAWLANITLSIQNDNIQRDESSLMITIQSWVANSPRRAKSILLEREIQPYEYWNRSIQVYAHDIDDTSFKIYIQEDRIGNGDFITVGEPMVIPSQKDLYIFDVKINPFEDILYNKMANVTVTVFNEGESRFIGYLYLEVWYYYMGISNYDGEENANTINTNENWEPILNVNANKLDEEISEPLFVINLYYDGKLIDEHTQYGYSK